VTSHFDDEVTKGPNRNAMVLKVVFFLALNQGSYATGYFGFVEQKSDGIIFIKVVAVCIFQYQTFSH